MVLKLSKNHRLLDLTLEQGKYGVQHDRAVGIFPGSSLDEFFIRPESGTSSDKMKDISSERGFYRPADENKGKKWFFCRLGRKIRGSNGIPGCERVFR